MPSLSPILLADFRRQQSMRDPEGSTLQDAIVKKRRTEEIIEYACGECGERYEVEEEADKCCLPEATKLAPNQCPVCADEHDDSHAAVSCCLWKDISPADRWRIAWRMERGEEWPEAIAAVTSDTRLLS